MAVAAVKMRSLDGRKAAGGTAEAGPRRRCIVSGRERPKQELIRFVAGPDGCVVPDVAGRLPGRGLWVSPARDMITAACKRNLFAKAARAPLTVPEDLADQVERLLLRRCLELLGLARRAGLAVAGHEKVKSWLSAGRAGLLIQAVDGADEGRRRLRALARAADPDLRVVELFTAEELGRALGQGAWVHVAVAPGGMSERLVAEAARLAGLRGQTDPADNHQAPPKASSGL
jgi:predicted RNA-binding protein YlxR (DUF448 family)